MPHVNEYGQPVGDPVAWTGARQPAPVTLDGAHVRLRPLRVEDAAAVVEVLACHEHLWTYQSTDAPRSLDEARRLVQAALDAHGVTPFAIVDTSSEAFLGRVHLLRAQPLTGSIEVGAVVYSPGLQRTVAATEAQYLLAEHVFDTLGYRRYEWKCDSLNEPSRRAGLRLGFREEGTWRNALVTKGRNRDTTWFAMTDADWPSVRAALRAWLAPGNLDAAGRQVRTLAAIREQLP